MAFSDKLTLRQPASYLFIAFFIFLLFPHPFFQPVTGGLDGSYDLALHLALKDHLLFGRDIVSVFGPLAILNSRFPIGVDKWVYLLLDIYFLLTVFLIGKEILKKRVGFFAALFLFLGLAVEVYDSAPQRYFLFFLFYLFSFIQEPRRWIPLIQAALLSALSFFYRADLGIPAFLLFIIGLGYVLVSKKTGWQRLLLTAAIYLSCILLSARMLNVDLKGYVGGSLHIIDASMDAPLLAGNPRYAPLFPTAAFIILLMTALSIALLANILYKKNFVKYRDEVFIYGVVLLSSFLLFKSGFVRFIPTHPFVFFRVISLLAGLLYLFTPSPARKLVGFFAWAILIRSTVSIQMLPAGGLPDPGLLRLLSIRAAAIRDYFYQLKEYKKDPDDHSIDIIPSALPGNYQNYMSPGAPDRGSLLPSTHDTTSGKMGEDLPVSDRYDQYTRIFVRPTLSGRISRLLYLPPLLKITLTLENGEPMTYRVTPSMLADGVIFNRIKKFRLEEYSTGAATANAATGGTAAEGGFRSDIKIVTDGYSKLMREPDPYRPLAADPSFYATDTFHCWVDSLDELPSVIRIKGWAYRTNSRDENVLVKAVLRSGDTLYELPSERQDRLDVADYYQRKEVVRGFIASIGKSELPPGNYQVGILMIDTLLNKKWVRYTDHRVMNK